MIFWVIVVTRSPPITAYGMMIQLRYGGSLRRHTWKDDNRKGWSEPPTSSSYGYFYRHTKDTYIMKLATYTYKDRTRVGAVVEDRVYMTSELDSMQYMI